MSSTKGRYTTSVGSMRRSKQIGLILRIILAIVMLIFALFPVLWIFSASINPTNSLVGQPLIPAKPNLGELRRSCSTTRSIRTHAGMSTRCS